MRDFSLTPTPLSPREVQRESALQGRGPTVPTVPSGPVPDAGTGVPPVVVGTTPKTEGKAPFAVTGTALGTPPSAHEVAVNKGTKDWTPTYTVPVKGKDGTATNQNVQAKTHFRMNGGLYTSLSTKETKARLSARLPADKLTKYGLTEKDLDTVASGKADSKLKAKVKAALIKEGALDEPAIKNAQPPMNAEKPERRLEWHYGLDAELTSAEAQTRIGKKLSPTQMKAAGITGDDLQKVTTGRGTPEQCRKVTQALIDAGALDDPGIANPQPADTATKIRRLQWEYGIGVDCQGSLRTVLAGAGAKNLPPSSGDLVSVGKSGYPLSTKAKGMESSPSMADRWQPVVRGHETDEANGDFGGHLKNVKAGDVLKLDDKSGDVGHYVVVENAHDVAPGSDEAKAMGMKDSKGPIKVMSVFSSWGAGGDRDYDNGGVRRETWVCDAGQKPPKWGSLKDDGTVDWKAEVHENHTFVGAYRPK